MANRPEKKKTAVYVIDRQYRLIYANDALKQIFPRLQMGETCYRELCGEEYPCRECPLCRKDEGEQLFYNRFVETWVEVTCADVEWQGEDRCHIIMAKGIQSGNKNLFYSLTHISAYDELFELNLTRDAYKILYHLDGKYVIPAKEGRLVSMMDEVADHMIHPDDRQAFQEFWNLDNLFARMQGGGEDHMLKGQFRKRLTDGGYCWVQQTVVPLMQGDKDDRIVMCFIQDIQEQKRKELERLEEGAAASLRLDRLTGLYRREVFFQLTEQFLRQNPTGEYCLMAVDIEHFKLFNEWYGQEAGDQFLKNIAAHLKAVQETCGGPAGYLGGDDFGILLPDDPDVIEKLQNEIRTDGQRGESNAGFLPAYGLYAIEDRSLPAHTMYDRAAMALASVKGNYRRRYNWYNSGMKQEMEAAHKLLSEMQRALADEEFIFYLQPQCNLSTGKIVGLESLVRWNHPQRGIISPGEFIPVLEQNGLIASLDLYTWDKVCACVRQWIDRGYRPVPVSVNVSRIDILTFDVVACFSQLIDKYRLPQGLVEIEITESAYAEQYETFKEVIDKLRKAGFLVFMDDFGSGYSSLNMLKDVNVDVLKIDMKFLSMEGQSAGKGMGILETITSMARLMGLRMIAEGVETREQMDFLLDMGCLYGQGYYLHRPMPVKDCEAILMDEGNIDFRGICARTINRLQIKELLTDDIFSETMMNNILGGIGLYDVCGEQIEPFRVNEQYCKICGTNLLELEENRNLMMNSIYLEDRRLLQDIFQRAYEDQIHGADGIVRKLKGDGTMIWVYLRVFLLREQDGHRLYYGSLSDVTQQKEQEKRLESSQRALAAVMDVAQKDEAFMKLTEENRRQAASIFAQISPGGMIGGYCEDGFPLYFANHEMVRLLGYDSYEEFAEAIGWKVENTIHPDDREQVAKDIGPAYYAGLEYTTTYRMPKKDGEWFWTLDKGRVVQAEDGRLAIVSACTDISEPMLVQQQLSERNATLLRQNQELHFLNNDLPGGYHRCADTPEYDFLHISNRFLEIFGYTREEIADRFDNKMLNMIHPDDRGDVAERVKALRQGRKIPNIEYRMQGSQGYVWVIDQSQYMEYGGNTFLQGVVLDVTETVELRKRMELLMEHMPVTVAYARMRGEDSTVQIIAGGVFEKLGLARGGDLEKVGSQAYKTMVRKKDRVRVDETVKQAVRTRQNYRDVMQMNLPSGEKLWISLDGRYLGEEEDEIDYLCIYSDISETKRKEEKLSQNEMMLTRLAERDALTGLLNRQAAIPRIKALLESGTDRTSALIMFDMDNFKLVNDVFGHAYGDIMIAENAEKLRKFFRGEDIICRIGGDEFLVLCRNIGESDMRKRLTQVVKDMTAIFVREEKEMRFSISAGYVMIPEQGQEFDALYRKADIALFAAKMSGRGSYRKYDSSMPEIRYELAEHGEEGR